MKKCMLDVVVNDRCCNNTECRMYMDYAEDLNCTLVAVEKHGDMTLQEIAVRHGISLVRVKQIADAAMEKIKKPLLTYNTI